MMHSEKMPSVPTSIAGYVVLPLSLPPIPSFPTSATHYLYLAPHEPKIPSPTASRSLFLVNVPFDATEAHIKHLFSSQLALSHGRVEHVLFEADKKRGYGDEGAVLEPATHEKRGNKRKRVAENGPIEDYEGAALPETWDRKLQHIGGTAVVLFVDKASMDAALKEAKKKRKEGRQIVWGEGVEEKLPKLGSTSRNHTPAGSLC